MTDYRGMSFGELLRACRLAAGHTQDSLASASGVSLREQKRPPPLGPVEAAFQGYIEELSAVRREGLTRNMNSETAERFFALGFALEQLREHLLEVQRVVSEWARE